MPLRNAEPIPWEQLKAIRKLSTIPPSPRQLKVTLRLPETSGGPDDTAELKQKRDGKRKYVAIASPTSDNEDINVKDEEVDITMVSHSVGSVHPLYAVNPYNE